MGNTSIGWNTHLLLKRSRRSNHLDVVLKTPEPKLARGMQYFLSAYANVWSRRHRFNGHVFRGRCRTELIEDETYLSGRC